MASGKVYLVGAGPGDVGYLTVRGREAIAAAQVLVYDALADNRLLALVPSQCQLLNVGKRGGQPSPPQAVIDAKLVELCRAGYRVVRLKSGDPFIFGRSASEIQALNAANCDYEVIPGISSALAAPLFAGIPLTDPVISRGFAVFSAHDLDALDWESLARLETLVLLMGGRNLRGICDRLLAQGRASRTPIAVIRWAGREQQQVWTGDLDDITDRTAGELLSPAVIVVGEVVQLRSFLQPDIREPSAALEAALEALAGYPKTKPNHNSRTRPIYTETDLTLTPKQALAGQTILVTRAADQSGGFLEQLTAAGATAIAMPALEIRRPSSWAALDRALADLASFHWLILTSSNAVDYFFDRLLECGQDLRAIAHLKLAVVGKKTAASLRSRQLQPDYIPPDYIADSLVKHFPESVAGLHILFPRVETGGREVLTQELRDRGAIVTEVPAYESGCPQAIAPPAFTALRTQAVDVITFASSKTVRNFAKLVTQAGLDLETVVSHCTIASIGPQTSDACRQELGRCDLEAEQYTIDGLYAALEKWAARSA